VAEVRPIAFRSMLRYWFRALALGFLSPLEVRKSEMFVFGGITPKAKTGQFQLEIANPDTSSNSQAGTLILHHSIHFRTADENQQQAKLKRAISQLLISLTWLMFHLGGVGQGARRPYYQRAGNPPHRGVNLSYNPEQIQSESMRENWILPRTPQEFQQLFQQRLEKFYSALGKLIGRRIDYNNPPANVIAPTAHTWVEAIDSNCEILVIRKAVQETKSNPKPYPLKVLVDQFHDLESHSYTEAKSLCGGIEKKCIKNGDEIDRDVIPSPVWISNLHKYQVVTVFGANQEPRREYLNKLKNSLLNNNFDSYAQIWPINQ
jgi:CRISPR-associated protein Cmr6